MLYSNDISQLRSISLKAWEFYSSKEMDEIEIGRYELGDGDFVNVESYLSRGRDASRYESHVDYVDIQVVLEGSEIIEVAPVGALDVAEPYSPEKDIAFYGNEVLGDKFNMKPGRFLALMPNDAHMPGVTIEGKELVKKAVFKLRLRKPATEAVRVLVMDVDGTLTDGSIHTGTDGELYKSFNVKDGLGIHELLPKLGIVPVIITGRQSTMLEKRCAELGIEELHQGVADKTVKLDEVLGRLGYSISNVAYIGDDLNDLSCMQAVKAARGFVACPSDAVGEVKSIADFVSTKNGGHGAVRDFVSWLSQA